MGYTVEADERNDLYPCTEEKVKKIQEIVDGKMDIDFDMEMSLPAQVYNMFPDKSYYDKERREVFVKLWDVIACILEQGGIIDEKTGKQFGIIRCLDSERR